MKNDYKSQILTGLKYYTHIDDLTIQDVYGAMILLTRSNKLRQVSQSLWTKKQFEYLYQRVIDGDSCYFLEDFRDAVQQTRQDRKNKTQKETAVSKSQSSSYDYPDYDEVNPEEDMMKVSELLLRDDEVYFS